jgi:hypothetical protein
MSNILKKHEIAMHIVESEPFTWLMVGANHPGTHIEQLKRAWVAWRLAGGKSEMQREWTPPSDDLVEYYGLKNTDEKESLDELNLKIKSVSDEKERVDNFLISIRKEIDCRIEHGAESGGHLEAIRSMIDNRLNDTSR